MRGHLKKAVAIAQFCRMVEDQVCNTIDCEHEGRSCEAVGCDNHACRMHENYCSGCEQRYCEDCFEGHLEGCRGPAADGHDQGIEQALTQEVALLDGDLEKPRKDQEVLRVSHHPQRREPSLFPVFAHMDESRVPAKAHLESGCETTENCGTGPEPRRVTGLAEGDEAGGSQ
jgi:hypothetical protein